MAAAVAMLMVLPALADIATGSEVTLQGVGSNQSGTDDDLKWISTDPDADPPSDSATAGTGNQVLVIVHDEKAFTDGQTTVTVDVETSAGSAKIKVDVASTNSHYEGSFEVVTTATDDAADEIRGRQDGTITISYVPFNTAVNPFTQTVEIDVDEDGPALEGLVPDDKEYIDDEDVTFRAEAIDEQSGLGKDEDEAGSATLGTLSITWRDESGLACAPGCSVDDLGVDE